MSLLYKTTLKAVLFLALMLSYSHHSFAENGNPNRIAFSQESFETAKQRAISEGKLLFVDFYANWCTPCKWMDKTTFVDAEVVSMLNNNYISLKVDIDTPEGYGLKEKFSVGVLPTMLIFDDKGAVVERMQETLSRSKLLNLLSFHLNADNKVEKRHFFNQSPAGYEPSNYQENKEMMELYAAYQKKLASKSTYRLLIGDYNNYQSALRKVNEIRDQFIDEIIVLNDYKDGKVWYKVLMGKFTTIDDADNYRKILQNDHKINSIVF